MNLKQVYTILRKDLRIEVRRGYELISLVAFSVAAVLAFGYIYQNAEEPKFLFVFLWLMLLFIVVFTTITSFIREAERKTLFGLKALPCSPMTIYLSKFLYTLFLNSILGFTTLGLIGIFVGIRRPLIPEFYLLFLLELACLSAVSSFASALTMQSEGKTLLLPFLLFLFSLPSIMPAMNASENLIRGIDFTKELLLIAGYTILTLILSTFLISYLLED